MRASILVTFFLLVAQGQTPLPIGATKPSQPLLRQELLDRFAQAKGIREQLAQCQFPCEGESLSNRMQKFDEENVSRMRSIMSQYGWPGSDLVSEDGTVAAAALVLITNRHALKVEALPLVQASFSTGKTPGSSYAVLLDSILVSQGKPQRYGTVYKPTLARYAKLELEPIEDVMNVDKRRAEVGLPALSEVSKP
jgi:hypothetical protein